MSQTQMDMLIDGFINKNVEPVRLKQTFVWPKTRLQ